MQPAAILAHVHDAEIEIGEGPEPLARDGSAFMTRRRCDSLRSPSAGGLEATVRKKGPHRRAALCFLATSREW